MRHLIALALLVLAGCPSTATQCHPDAGPPDGGGLDPCTNRCYRPSGYWCNTGTGMDRCASDDGCNRCDCYATGNWVCTQALCIKGDLGPVADGGPSWPFCRNDADCPPQQFCTFDPDPTEKLGRCTRRQ